MKPFSVLENAKESYKTYVYTFQKFKNPAIKDWVQNRIDKGSLLWRNPNIQLSRRFEKGDTLESMIDSDLLHRKVLEIFSVAPEVPGSDTISPYKHQSESIKKILMDKKNTIISTGTGSGKSFCFGIPIVSDCLKMKEDGIPGIKALIVYPMNALANSQYSDFAKRLDGTGVKIALYTGDMKNSREEALRFLEETTGRTEPYDSEILSREEMRDDPPDILMTNYVMLEYILMRFEDKDLFPYEHRGNLRYMVLDEIHTYTGRRGADVAALLRRVKKRTEVTGEIKCIGTSATVETGEDEDSAELVSSFAKNLFGENFDPEDVIGESYVEAKISTGGVLPDEILVTDASIDGFEYDIDSTIPLVEELTGKDIDGEQTSLSLGDILKNQRTVTFLQNELLESSASMDMLERRYQEELRPDNDLKECQRELRAALLAGLVATEQYDGKESPLFTTKLHLFFSQGRTISSCLTKDGPHLHDKGDLVCNECIEESKERITLPLYFCRACGQEYFGASIKDDGSVIARDIDTDTEEYEDVYIYPKKVEVSELELPDMFYEKEDKLRKLYEEYIPIPISYCPEHNAFEDESAKCIFQNKLEVATIKKPFLFCPECGAHYDRRPREFNKLFSFGSVGRSTATDILISSLISELDEDNQKTIVFSDNRQDTSLQASHINNFQKRVHFRRGFYHALKNSDESKSLLSLDKSIFDIFEDNDVMPEYNPNPSRFGGDSLKDKYIQYLRYQLIQEVRSPPQKNQQNLEDAGIIRYNYRGLDEMANTQKYWDDEVSIPTLSALSPNERYDYLLGLLDIFRKQFALNHKYINDFYEFNRDVIDELADDALVELGGPAYRKMGYSDTADNKSKRAQVMRLTSGRSRLVVWTEKALGLEKDDAKDLVESIISILEREGFLKYQSFKYIGRLYQLTVEKLIVELIDDNEVKRCPICGNVYHFKELNICPGKKCSEIDPVDFSKEVNYFRDIYRMNFDDTVSLKAEEHSGQISGDERKMTEEKFISKDDPLNTIVCTPTMELGIDIGELSSVHMRNVPPSPTNYSQRAGRAGRKGQPSLITTFCGVGSKRGPHEQYFYKRPQKMISGKITQPRFLMDNRSLMETHLNSIIIEIIGSSTGGSGEFKLEANIESILNIDDHPNMYPMKSSFKDILKRKVSEEKLVIHSTFESAFSVEMETYTWLSDEFVLRCIDTFVDSLDKVFDYWRREYSNLNKDRHRIFVKEGKTTLEKHERRRRDAIGFKMATMREGKKGFYTFRYLQNQGFLPGYGFPTSSTHLVFSDKEDELVRDRNIALYEYAPGNQVYFKGSKYSIKHARPKMEDERPITRKILICPDCENILFDQRADTLSNCPNCNRDLKDTPPNLNGMEMPDQFAISGSKITSDEEERIRRGYDIQIGYDMGSKMDRYIVNGDSSFNMKYEHNGRIIKVNKGLIGGEDPSDGFSFCTECFKWLLSSNSVEKHQSEGNDKCSRNADEDDIIHGVFLFSEGIHDVITLNIPKPDFENEDDVEAFYWSIKEALIQGITVHLNLDEEEIDGMVKPDPMDDGAKTIIIYETFEGGTGALNSLTDAKTLREIFLRAREVMHEGEEDGCAMACYECLLNYYNQREHGHMDRNIALDFLKQFEKPRLIREGHEDHYQALLDRCESGFEREVLEEIEKIDIRLPDESQKTIYKGNEPIAEADFFYEPNVTVFVDGSPHDVEYISDMDKKKRDKLRKLGYRVISIRNMKDVEGLKEYLR